MKVHSAHPHRIATYDERGVQTTGGEVVLVLLEFCPGGSIEDHLALLRGTTQTAGARGGGDETTRARGGGGRSIDGSQINRDSLSTPAVGPKSKQPFTTEGNPVSRVEDDEGRLQGVPTNSGAGSERQERNKGVSRDGGVVDRVGAVAPRVLSRRLEVWVRQVRARLPLYANVRSV